MPVRVRNINDLRADDERYQNLRARLVAEWRGEGGEAPNPDIDEIMNAQGRLTQVIVTWEAWADLDAQTRSEMIVDAFQVIKGAGAIVDLSLAMGLTPAEATRLRRG